MDDQAAQPPTLRAGSAREVERCVALWVSACAERDGQAIPGVAERARPRFDESIGWLVAQQGEDLVGFALATGPGSGTVADPEDAAVVALLAVAPGQQARGLGRRLLRSATAHLTSIGYRRAVLHALLDNAPAVRLYESEGWVSVGETYEHSLLNRPLRMFERTLQ